MRLLTYTLLSILFLIGCKKEEETQQNEPPAFSYPYEVQKYNTSENSSAVQPLITYSDYTQNKSVTFSGVKNNDGQIEGIYQMILEDVNGITITEFDINGNIHRVFVPGKSSQGNLFDITLLNYDDTTFYLSTNGESGYLTQEKPIDFTPLLNDDPVHSAVFDILYQNEQMLNHLNFHILSNSTQLKTSLSLIQVIIAAGTSSAISLIIQKVIKDGTTPINTKTVNEKTLNELLQLFCTGNETTASNDNTFCYYLENEIIIMKDAVPYCKGMGICKKDCNGDIKGTATIDECGICSGGNTGVTPNECQIEDLQTMLDKRIAIKDILKYYSQEDFIGKNINGELIAQLVFGSKDTLAHVIKNSANTLYEWPDAMAEVEQLVNIDLPDSTEIKQFYLLHKMGLGDFENAVYWTKTTYPTANYYNVYGMDFTNGEIAKYPPSSTHYVRFLRAIKLWSTL